MSPAARQSSTLHRRAVLTGASAALVTGSTAWGHEASPIRQAGYVPIGGIGQWIDVRGEDRRNPAILVIHGGPGSTWDPFMGLFRPWERRFTMAYWSQRGAGKTFRLTGETIGPTMTIGRMAEDGVEAAEYLCKVTGQDKVILLCHSWGTVLGLEICARRPDLVAAYVGTGQVVSGLEGERAGRTEVLARARRAGHSDAVAELEAMGEPPYDDIGKMVAERRWAQVFAPPSEVAFETGWRNPPEFTAADAAERNRAWLFSNYRMWGHERQDGPMMAVDVRSRRQFETPMLFLQGELDPITPAALVQPYAESLKAPKVDFVSLQGGGHDAVFVMPDRFLAEITRRLA